MAPVLLVMTDGLRPEPLLSFIFNCWCEQRTISQLNTDPRKEVFEERYRTALVCPSASPA
jgi:hypothetical protein